MVLKKLAVLFITLGSLVNQCFADVRQAAWVRPPDYIMSRANYSGHLLKDAIRWVGTFQVEVVRDGDITVPLFPRSITLSDIKLDGKDAAILSLGDSFATRVSGKGAHEIVAEFLLPLPGNDSATSATLTIAPIPVSKIELTLPGKKELVVSPEAHVGHRYVGSETIATANLSMTDHVALTWSDALPDAIKNEARAQVMSYHLVHAEEGVLSVRALVRYELTRGKLQMLSFSVPKGVEVNRVSAGEGIQTEWRLARGEGPTADTLVISLDRPIRENLDLEIAYDHALPKNLSVSAIDIPLLNPLDVQRHRGMVALLGSKEFTLKPNEENEVTKVGENQLPAAIRDGIKMTVAHTYKFVDSTPRLRVNVAPPERKQGRFDAEVNTLVSLSDVLLRGSATLDFNMKTGGVENVALKLPKNLNILSLTGPSLRSHKVVVNDLHQEIDVQFTQEMEGQFSLELIYEQLLSDTEASVVVPTVAVNGAEIEQGRIAIEALSAVEVQPVVTTSLSSLELTELPQQLVMKTSNPILHAYRYVRVDPAYELQLKLIRHREAEVQNATIDQAHYKTIVTKDGFSVTAASFVVRNTRSQFLRLTLPEGSQIWSVSVNGSAEKPAIAETDAAGAPKAVLIRIINSAQGFPVNLVYQSAAMPLRGLGSISHVLPRPDIMVTDTQWDLYVPNDFEYGRVQTNMNEGVHAEVVSSELLRAKIADMNGNGRTESLASPQLSVPTSGLHFSFTKLYANQGDEDPFVQVPYVGSYATKIVTLFQILAVAAILLGVRLYRRVAEVGGTLPRSAGIAALGGVVVYCYASLYLGFSGQLALVVFVVGLGFEFWGVVAEYGRGRGVGSTER